MKTVALQSLLASPRTRTRRRRSSKPTSRTTGPFGASSSSQFLTRSACFSRNLLASHALRLLLTQSACFSRASLASLPIYLLLNRFACFLTHFRLFSFIRSLLIAFVGLTSRLVEASGS